MICLSTTPGTPINNADPFPMTASNVPQGPAQNVNFPSHPFLFNGSLPWNFIWPSVLPSLPDRPCQHTSADQNVQANGSCPNCATHPTAGAFQFGAGPPVPVVQENTALSMATSSSSSSSNPTAPLAMPPVSEAPPLLHPGVTDAGPSASTSTSTENAYARKSRRVPPARNPRRRREVPLVRIEEHIEWVRHDVMKMTVWFNLSPDADAEAHEAWG
jgi:hypothetical protein